MTTVADDRTTAAGAFVSGAQAERAIADLREHGFDEADIRVRGPAGDSPAPVGGRQPRIQAALTLFVTSGLLVVLAGGWVAFFYPALWTAYIGGAVLAALAIVGGIGMLVEMGRSMRADRRASDEVGDVDGLARAGQSVVLVRAGSRVAEAAAILRRHGAADMAGSPAPVARA